MEQTVSNFLQLLRIPVSKKYIQKLISSHPDFPSLLSICDILERMGIDHVAKRISEEDLRELPYPYLLPLDRGKGDILLIKDKYDLSKHENELKLWGGVVLQANATVQTKDKINNNIYLKETHIRNLTVALLVTTGILLLLLFDNSFHSTAFAILLTAIAGAAVGYILLAKEMGISYASIDAFCNAGKNTNCDKVLTAEINLFGVKFSDAVATYFLFQVITLVLNSSHSTIFASSMEVLAILSVMTLPIILFSLYYQFAVVKTWCRLCLIVVTILAVQSFIFGMGYIRGSIKPLTELYLPHQIPLALLFVAIGLAVLLIRSTKENANELEKVGINGNRVKHSLNVFNKILSQQRVINSEFFEKEMRLGNPDAPLKIVMVSNLYCNPCKEKHAVVDQLLTAYPAKLNITLRFVRSRNHKESVRYLLHYWQQFIYGKDNETENTLKLMHDWFDLMDHQKFMKKYLTELNSSEAEKLEERQYAWIDEIAAHHTPTFFINGYELPKEYSIDDLLAMVPALADFISKDKSGVVLSNVQFQLSNI